MTLLQCIQISTARRLSGDPYFAGSPPIPVIPKCDADPLGKLGNALAQAGAGVLIMPAKGKFTRLQTPQPGVDLTLMVRCLENPSVNRSRGGAYQTADDIAWSAAQLLWLWTPVHPDTGAALTGGSLVLSDIECGEVTDKDGHSIFYAEFTADVTLQDLRRTLPIRSE